MSRSLAIGLCLLASLVAFESHAETVREHRIAEDDIRASLADRYWGDARLGPGLAHFAAVDEAHTLPVGEVLSVPFLVDHEVRRSETLVRVSRAYYGTPRHAAALASLNGIGEPDRLRVGRRIRVPVFEPRSAAPLADAPVLQPAAPRRAAPKARGPHARELRQAVNTLLDGGFDAALTRLEELRAGVLAQDTRDERLLLLRALVFAYVAFERQADACNAYRAFRELDPDTDWDPELVSPRILDAVADCNPF